MGSRGLGTVQRHIHKLFLILFTKLSADLALIDRFIIHEKRANAKIVKKTGICWVA